MDVGAAVEKAVVPILGMMHGRRHYRQRIYSLAYVNVNQGNGGIIRDLSETGVGVQTVAALRTGEEVSLRFELFGPRVRMEASGRVAWATSSGQAGIEFISIPLRLKRLLKEWIFIQILSTAHSAAWDSMFRDAGAFESHSSTDSGIDEIQREAAAAALELLPEPKENRFLLLKSPRMLAWLVDGLIVLGGVFLFWLIAMGITHALAGWKTTAIFTLAAGLVFSLLYRALFLLSAGVTPGTYFAESKLMSHDRETEEAPRFR
ncbi:MAG: hypothetical protein DMG91_01615 [Acidobacteria bacterium]|nr:MAG: hypothetical protein DMG91_01615 [Acidobacteriota bacterium]